MVIGCRGSTPEAAFDAAQNWRTLDLCTIDSGCVDDEPGVCVVEGMLADTIASGGHSAGPFMVSLGAPPPDPLAIANVGFSPGSTVGDLHRCETDAVTVLPSCSCFRVAEHWWASTIKG